MNPTVTIWGLSGPWFLNQVPTLVGFRMEGFMKVGILRLRRPSDFSLKSESPNLPRR